MAPTTNATYQDMEGGQSLLVATPSSTPKYSMLVKVLCTVAVAATVGIAYTAGAHSVGQGAVTNFASFSDVDGNFLRSMNMQEDAYGDIDEDDEGNAEVDAYGRGGGEKKIKNNKSKKVKKSLVKNAKGIEKSLVKNAKGIEKAGYQVSCKCKKARKMKKGKKNAAYGEEESNAEVEGGSDGEVEEDDSDDDDDSDEDEDAFGGEDEDAYGGKKTKKGKLVSSAKLCKYYCKANASEKTLKKVVKMLGKVTIAAPSSSEIKTVKESK